MARRRANRKRSETRMPQSFGEVWNLQYPLVMPGGDPKSLTRSILVMENSDRLSDSAITRVLIAPISTSSYNDVLDYIIEPGQHDHCNLTQESAVVVTCIQPVLKEAFEGGNYRGHINQEGVLTVQENLLELFGVVLED